MAEIINPLTTGAPAAIYLRLFRLSKRCSWEVRYSGIFPPVTASSFFYPSRPYGGVVSNRQGLSVIYFGNSVYYIQFFDAKYLTSCKKHTQSGCTDHSLTTDARQ